jgi:hypothetical protein
MELMFVGDYTAQSGWEESHRNNVKSHDSQIAGQRENQDLAFPEC